MSARTTICIVHHNAPDWLEASLRRIGRHTSPGTPILVVENGSNAEIRDMAKVACKAYGAETLMLPEAVSHGAALDAAVARISTPWMLTMDTDAFPVRDGWLQDMHAAADKMVLIGSPAAASHSENPFGNYVHPSLCLVDMRFLRHSEVCFRDAWPRWDTGEQLTIEAMRLGLGVRYLSTAGFNLYGSGVIIGGFVFHAYYGTRLKVLSAQELLNLDGVDAKTLRADHTRLLEAEKEFASGGPDPFATLTVSESPRPEMSVIVPFRRRDDMTSKSLEVVLRSLNMQTMERQRYEIIVVETALAATVPESTGYRTILAHCHSPHFRKSWAMNVGFRHASGDILVFHDADIIAPETMLESITSSMGKSTPAVKPSFTVLDMSRGRTEDLHRLGVCKEAAESQSLRAAPGGCVAVMREAFLKVHGYNEGFVGWGGEDDEFLIRLRACGWNPPDLGCKLYHLWHTHAARNPERIQANRQLLNHIRRLDRRAVRKYIASMSDDFGNVLAHRKRAEPIKESSRTRILLVGAYSKRGPDTNAGDDATRDVLLRLLRRKGCSVRISPKHPCDESRMLDSDGVVVGGGGLVSDHNEDAFYNYMSYIKHAAERGIPISFVGIGVTRLSRKRRRISSLLRGALSVCLRDTLSQEHLENGEFAAVTSDLGWLLEDQPAGGHFANTDKTMAGVFVVGNSYADSEKYRSCVHKCVDSLVDEGLRPMLVMHARDDKRATSGFLERYPSAGVLDYFASEKNTAASLVRALSNMSKVITSRYHGIVFSVLAGTPVRVISESPGKVLFLRDEIGADRLADESELPAVLREMRRRARGSLKVIEETVAKARRLPLVLPMNLKVSVCMITHNDASYMRRALAGIPRISQVGEILAVDGGSEDDTVSIMEKDGRARILRRPFPHDFSDQKNFCISQAKNNWIVWIDPDEVMPEEFWESMSELVSHGREAFQFPRENFVGSGPNPDNDIKVNPDHQFRFFSKKCRWVGRIHENLTGYEGEVGKADFIICHRKSRDRQDWNNRYYAWIHGSNDNRPSGHTRVEA